MKRAEIIRRFDEIVAFAEIEKFLDTPVKRYSSGMYVRLAFAIAAHLEPEVLVVDEVLAVGDASFQKKCMGKMDNVAREGRTVVFVSHNMAAVKTLCPRAILLNQGLIEMEGNTPEVVQHYLGTGGAMSGHMVWLVQQRPGNRSFRINSVTLKALDGSPTSSVEISTGALVEIDFEVIEEGAQAVFLLLLSDLEANDIFWSLSNVEQNYYGKPLRCGRYISTCRLPGDLLNSGVFSISIVGCGAHWGGSFRVDNVLSFSAIDDGVLRGDYFWNYAGPLRPRLEWNTRRGDISPHSE
jgi:lipopolysaccharide transport system ATP-binding protein